MTYTKAYTKYYHYVYSICKNILTEKTAAEDATQETLYQLMIKWDSITDYDNLYAWLQKVARNTCLNIIRKQKRELLCNEVTLPDISDQEAVASLFRDAAVIANNLSPKYREVFQLAFVQGYKNQEIAEILKIPLSTVKTRIRTCLQKLRHELI